MAPQKKKNKKKKFDHTAQTTDYLQLLSHNN